MISITTRRVAMVLYALPKLFFYERLLRKLPVDTIVRNMAEKSLYWNLRTFPGKKRKHDLLILWKACHFIQIRLLRKQKPCLPRSLLLFEWCMAQSQEAGLVVGVKKTGGRLEGHSWLLIEGVPFMENQAFVDTYHVIFGTDTQKVHAMAKVREKLE